MRVLTDLVNQFGPIPVVLATTLLGWLVGLVLGSSLRWTARTRNWPAGTALADSMRGLPLVWGALVGARLLLPTLELTARAEHTAVTWLRVLWILSFTWLAVRLVGRLVQAWISRDDTQVPSGTIFVNLARIAAFIIGVLVALATAGVSIAPLLTASAVGGLAVALALQDTLGNLFSGLQVVLSKQIKPGDFIRLESGQEGWVHDVTWRNTTIKQLSNDLVIVPNSVIGKSLVTNFTSMDEQHSVTVPFQVGYDADLAHVERVVGAVACEVMSETPGAVAECEPVVRFREFGDWSIRGIVVLRASSYADRAVLVHEFVKRLQARFAAEGIAFPLPTSEVVLEEVRE
jgi:small-conductance mechanosensitive channel